MKLILAIAGLALASTQALPPMPPGMTNAPTAVIAVSAPQKFTPTRSSFEIAWDYFPPQAPDGTILATNYYFAIYESTNLADPNGWDEIDAVNETHWTVIVQPGAHYFKVKTMQGIQP